MHCHTKAQEHMGCDSYDPRLIRGHGIVQQNESALTCYPDAPPPRNENCFGKHALSFQKEHQEWSLFVDSKHFITNFHTRMTLRL